MPKITKKEKLRRKKQMITRMDAMASTWVRNQDDICVSCKRKLPYKKRQCGHFIRRDCWKTRWDPKNLHIECPSCNGFSPDHLIGYSQFMLNEGLFDWASKRYFSFIQRKTKNKFKYKDAKKWYIYWYKLCKKDSNCKDVLKRGWEDVDYFNCVEDLDE